MPSTPTEGEAPLMIAAQLTGGLVGSAFYYRSAVTVAWIAAILDDDDTAREMTDLADRIRDAFIQEYVLPDGRLTVHMQGTYVLALTFDLVPEDLVASAGRRLVDLIHAADDHLDTGFLSVPYLLDVLTAIGEKDLAYRVLFQDTLPSWLYAVKMGAATMRETWGGVAPDGQPKRLSLNHYAFGCRGLALPACRLHHLRAAGIRHDLFHPRPRRNTRHRRCGCKNTLRRGVNHLDQGRSGHHHLDHGARQRRRDPQSARSGPIPGDSWAADRKPAKRRHGCRCLCCRTPRPPGPTVWRGDCEEGPSVGDGPLG